MQKDINIHNNTLALLLISGLILYQTFNLAGGFFAKIIFVISSFFTLQSIKLSLYFSYFYEILFILMLSSIFFLIDKKKTFNLIDRINLRFFKKVGIAFLIFYLMNVGSSFLTMNKYGLAMENYANQLGGFDNLGEKLLYIELMPSIFSWVKGTLVISLFFFIIWKEQRRLKTHS